jgi:hypothetical protein
MPNPVSSQPPLAVLADVENRMPRALTSAEVTRVPYLLQDASSQIRKYTRQFFSLETTTDFFKPNDSRIDLPEHPVVSVNSLARVNVTGSGTTPYALWVYDQQYSIFLGPISQVLNAPMVFADMSWIYRSVMYEVNYTHGYAVIPDDIVSVAANMVLRVLLSPNPGVSSETQGSFSFSMQANFVPGQVSLTMDDKQVLSVYRNRRNRSIEMGG